MCIIRKENFFSELFSAVLLTCETTAESVFMLKDEDVSIRVPVDTSGLSCR